MFLRKCKHRHASLTWQNYPVTKITIAITPWKNKNSQVGLRDSLTEDNLFRQCHAPYDERLQLAFHALLYESKCSNKNYIEIQLCARKLRWYCTTTACEVLKFTGNICGDVCKYTGRSKKARPVHIFACVPFKNSCIFLYFCTLLRVSGICYAIQIVCMHYSYLLHT